MQTTLGDLEALDRADPLRGLREAFVLPDGVVYLDGNSLGALPRKTLAHLQHVVMRQWGEGLVRSWTAYEWIDAPQRVGDKIARLIGAAAGEVVVTDSTSVNLFKLLAAACRLRPDRPVILSEPGNFPNDLYVAQGLRDLGADHIELRLVPAGEIGASIDKRVAVVLLTHVNYKSAAMHDMARITARAHAHGALTLWDLSHSAGAIAVDLNVAQADFAVGCGYKYLNGGPGAPAYLFVARRHQASAVSPITGWLGHARPFDFVDDYAPAPGISRFLAGTHPILAIAALEVGVDLMLATDPQLRLDKSRRLSELFVALVESRCAGLGLELASPRDPHARGSHVVLRHPQSHAVMHALIDRGVIGDFRASDLMRFGFAPLYNRYMDLWHAVEILR
ncbi:MAG: kynureninase, partial [Burkholderiaceae bacterium]|nr:kynureninase [Burkholderiaceae bacterium]